MSFPGAFGVVLLLAAPQAIRSQQAPPVSELVRRFERETVFWRQIEVARQIVAAKDTSVLPGLEPWLTHEDRHLRGNAGFLFAGLGDSRGLDVITAILSDRSERRPGEGSGGFRWSLRDQIRQDRYYAAHLLGDLKDVRAVPILVPLLKDADVSYIVPWSLGQIGDPSAIQPLIGLLSDPDPNLRVLAIYGLRELNAVEALPRLRQLLTDQEKCNFDKLESVAQASETAIASLLAKKER